MCDFFPHFLPPAAGCIDSDGNTIKGEATAPLTLKLERTILNVASDIATLVMKFSEKEKTWGVVSIDAAVAAVKLKSRALAFSLSQASFDGKGSGVDFLKIGTVMFT